MFDDRLRSISAKGLLRAGDTDACVTLGAARGFAGGSDSSLEMLCLLPMLGGVLDEVRPPRRRYLMIEGLLVDMGRFHFCVSVGMRSLMEKERRDADSDLESSAVCSPASPSLSLMSLCADSSRNCRTSMSSCERRP